MAVLGSGGRLELRREAPSACVILPSDLHSNGSFDLGCEGYWPGDKVVISNPDGLPIFINGNPQRWDGVTTYVGSELYVAQNRDHIVSTDSDFYKKSGALNNSYFRQTGGYYNDNALFYYQGSEPGDDPITEIEGYLCIDSLGRCRLYETRCEGLNCCGKPVVDFGSTNLAFDFMVINQAGTSEYQNALTKCFGDIGEYIFNDIASDAAGVPDPNRAVDSICADPPLYLNPVAGSDEFANADIQPRADVNRGPHPLWTVLCDVKEWSLELDAPSVDTTGVGEKFGEAVKSLVTGGGSADFFIDRRCYEDGTDNGLYMMQLLLMTQMEGCKARAKFFMLDRPSNGEDCKPSCDGELPGSLWYETEILVTRNAVNLRPTELVAGTANFVTTGEIRLKQGTVSDP